MRCTLLIFVTICRNGLGLSTIKKAAETLAVAESLAKSWNISKSESVSLIEAFRRNSKAVVSDILIGQSDITPEGFDALLASAQAPGYTAFVPFMVGDHEYQKAIFKAGIRSSDVASARLTNLSVEIDVPDTFDSGTVAGSVGGTNVAFNKAFYKCLS